MSKLQLIIVCSIFLFSGIIYSQEKGKLSLSFEYNSQQFALERVNGYLLDTNYFSTYTFNEVQTNQIKKGHSFGLSASYQALSFADFGIYGSYQVGKITRTPYFYEDLDPVWNPGQNIITHEGQYSFDVYSIFVGIKATLYINKLLKLDEKSNVFLNNLIIGTELKGGYGFASTKETYAYPSFQVAFPYSSYSSQNFQGKIGLQLGYILSKKSIFSAIGLNLGYQIFKTPVIKDPVGEELYYNNKELSANIDFSGLYFGAFLTIGK